MCCTCIHPCSTCIRPAARNLYLQQGDLKWKKKNRAESIPSCCFIYLYTDRPHKTQPVRISRLRESKTNAYEKNCSRKRTTLSICALRRKTIKDRSTAIASLARTQTETTKKKKKIHDRNLLTKSVGSKVQSFTEVAATAAAHRVWCFTSQLQHFWRVRKIQSDIFLRNKSDNKDNLYTKDV